MITQPTWVTDAGSLGTYREGEALDITLEASPSQGSNDAVNFINVDGSIRSVTIVRRGSGYITIPQVTVISNGIDSGYGANVIVYSMSVDAATGNSATSGSIGYTLGDELLIEGGGNTPSRLIVNGIGPLGRITSVAVVDPGNYISIPTNTSPVIVIPALDDPIVGNIAQPVIESTGSGYTTSLPVITVEPPSAIAVLGTVTVINGVITDIAIVNGGWGYTVAPTITITGSNIIAAAAVATLGTDSLGRAGSVVGINFLNQGLGYTSATATISVAPPIGTTAILDPIIGPGGRVVNVNVTNGGAGYLSPPIVSVTPPPNSGTTLNVGATGGTGTGARFDLSLYLNSLQIIDNGIDYVLPPIIEVDPPYYPGDNNQALLFASTNRGSGYTSIPKVTISSVLGDPGKDATAVAVLTNGCVTSITITDPGSGYVTPPNVYIDPPQEPTGTQAYPIAVIGQTIMSYKLQSGSLPPGLETAPVRLSSTGRITGIPKIVNVNATSTFTVRATDNLDHFRDRVFSITIAGPNIPYFLNGTGLLFDTLDSKWIDFQLLVLSPDPDPYIVTLDGGNLPPGLSVTAEGVITGYPLPPVDTFQQPITPYARYDFTLRVTKVGYSSQTSTQDYYIIVRNSDVPPVTRRVPALLNANPLTPLPVSNDPYKDYYANVNVRNLGTFVHDNYFAFKMIGYDFDANGGQIFNDGVVRGRITSGGTGYTSPPRVTIVRGVGDSTGTGAEINTQISSGSVVTINIQSPGYGYTVVPSAIVGGELNTITMTQVGLGYDPDNPPPVFISGTNTIGGEQATARAVINSAGNLYFTQLQAYGTGYTVAPQVTIPSPVSNAVVWASSTSYTSNTTVYWVNTGSNNRTNFYTVSSPGTTSTTPPTFTSGSATDGSATLTFRGTQAVATANLKPGSGATLQLSTTGISIISPGQGYSAGDAVYITPPDFINGVQASANITVDNMGSITDVILTNPGQGYTAVPRISIPNSVGTGANLQAILSFEYLIDGLGVINQDGSGTGTLTFDSQTGWITGVLPNLGNRIQTYQLTALVNKGSLYSTLYKYYITIQGNVTNLIDWSTTEVVGTLYNGEVSYLRVDAVSRAGLSLEYRLAPLLTQTLRDITFAEVQILRVTNPLGTPTVNSNIVYFTAQELVGIKIGSSITGPGIVKVNDAWPTVVEIDTELNTIRISSRQSIPLGTTLTFTTPSYVTVGDNGIIQYSWNTFRQWFQSDTDTVANFYGVVWFDKNNTFVACSDESNLGKIYTSGDGQNWVPIQTSFPNRFRGIATGITQLGGIINEEVLVAVSTEGKIFYTTDNSSWFLATVPGTVTSDFSAIVYEPINQMFYATTIDGVIVSSGAGSFPIFTVVPQIWNTQYINTTSPPGTQGTGTNDIFYTIPGTPYATTLYDINVNNLGVIIAVGTVRFSLTGQEQSIVLVSTNGGATFEPQPLWAEPPRAIYDVVANTVNYTLFLLYKPLYSVAPNPVDDNNWIIGSESGRIITGTHLGNTPIAGDPNTGPSTAIPPQFTPGGWVNYIRDTINDVYNIWVIDPARKTTPSYTPANPYIVEPPNILSVGTVGIIQTAIDATLPSDWVSINVENLPYSLSLLPSGDISGRVAFQPGITPAILNTTTRFNFVVQAYNSQNLDVTTTRQFAIDIVQVWEQPFETVYMKCMPGYSDRDKLLALRNAVPPELVFKPTDPYYGVQYSVYYQQQYGVYASDINQYLAAISENFYDRRLVLGPLKVANANRPDGTPLYDVIYSEIVDDLINPQGVSAVKELTWPRPISLNKGPYFDSLTKIYTSFVKPTFSTEKRTSGVLNSTVIPLNNTVGISLGQVVTGRGITLAQGQGGDADPSVVVVSITQNSVTLNVPQTLNYNTALRFSTPTWYTSLTPGTAQNLFPASTPNMRTQLGRELGQNTSSTILPRWMTSQQNEGEYVGSTLGYVAAAPIAYILPGRGQQALQIIQAQWRYTLNQVDFHIDRFEVDKSATYNWDNSILPPDWSQYPSSGVVSVTNQSKDFYVIFPQKTVLPNNSQG